jgi:hypothetical protein
MTTDEMKAWLAERLRREVSISPVTVNNTRCFLVDYINHSAPATKLVGASEDEAIANLFNYLQTVEAPATADSATKE